MVSGVGSSWLTFAPFDFLCAFLGTSLNVCAGQSDSSGFPEGLFDQRFQRWVRQGIVPKSALQRAYLVALATITARDSRNCKPAEAGSFTTSGARPQP